MTFGVYTPDYSPYQVSNNGITSTRVHKLSCVNNLSDILAAGYLNSILSGTNLSNINSTDIFEVNYGNGVAILQPIIAANGVIQLVLPPSQSVDQPILIGPSPYTIPNAVSPVSSIPRVFLVNSSSGDVTLPLSVSFGEAITIIAIGNGYNCNINYPNQTLTGAISPFHTTAGVAANYFINSTNTNITQTNPSTEFGQFITIRGVIAGTTGTWQLCENFGWST